MNGDDEFAAESPTAEKGLFKKIAVPYLVAAAVQTVFMWGPLIGDPHVPFFYFFFPLLILFPIVPFVVLAGFFSRYFQKIRHIKGQELLSDYWYFWLRSPLFMHIEERYVAPD